MGKACLREHRREIYSHSFISFEHEVNSATLFNRFRSPYSTKLIWPAIDGIYFNLKNLSIERNIVRFLIYAFVR